MGDLPSLARKLETTPIASLMAAAAAGRPAFFLSLDHDEPPGIALRPHLPGVHGEPTRLGANPRLLAAAAATPLSQLLEPMRPDPLTTVGDPGYLAALLAQRNLPPTIKAGVANLF
jgi:hypothetical protein